MKLRTAQKAKPGVGTDNGRFYVETDYIEVYGVKAITDFDTSQGKTTSAVRIARSQLERALKAMKHE